MRWSTWTVNRWYQEGFLKHLKTWFESWGRHPKGQINKWPIRLCAVRPIPAVMPLTGTVRWYGWAPEQKKVDVFVRTSFVLSIFGSVPVKGVTEWPPEPKSKT